MVIICYNYKEDLLKWAVRGRWEGKVQNTIFCEISRLSNGVWYAKHTELWTLRFGILHENITLIEHVLYVEANNKYIKT